MKIVIVVVIVIVIVIGIVTVISYGHKAWSQGIGTSH